MALPPVPTRCCSQCHQVLPLNLEHFHRDNTDAAGWQHVCKPCKAIIMRQRQKDHPEIYRAKEKAENQRLRLAALLHYSKGTLACACCGESALEFLAIDHETVKPLDSTHHGRMLYRWLRDNGYPPGFRVLCHNCNQALGFYGYCSHQVARRADDAV
jgi:hypothetical protein